MTNPTKYTSKVVKKRELNSMLKAIKDAKLPIREIDGNYILKTKSGETAFSAMESNGVYLVKHMTQLFN